MLKTISGWTILTCRTRRLTCTFEKCTNRPHHHPEQSRSWHSMENQPTHSRWLDIIRRVHQVKVIVWKVKCKWQFKHEQNSPKIIRSHRDLQRESVKSHFHRWWPLIIKFQHLSLSVIDAFGSAYDMLQQCDAKHQVLARTIEALPMTPLAGSGIKMPSCHDEGDETKWRSYFQTIN